MTFTVAPPIIEQADFTPGLDLQSEAGSEDPGSLLDVLNLLPDVGVSGSLVSRKGFWRLLANITSTGHYIKHIYPYRKGGGTQYLILVMTDESTSSNNVKLYAVDVVAGTASRIDTAGRTWANPTHEHWGLTIEGVYYGGSRGNDVYSWDGTTWNATANIGSWKTVVDAVDGAVNTATQYGRDYAFKGNEKVFYNSKVFTPARDIRYDTWEDGQVYDVGDRISSKSGLSYWKSFKCVKRHTASTGSNKPGVDSSWKTYWKLVRLPLPQNDENDTSDAWYFVPVAPGTGVAAWFADRIWLRFDGQGDNGRLIYSAPVKPEKGADVPGVVFDMTDFRPGNDRHGPGGGWLPFNDGRHGGNIKALHPYQQYLVVFKTGAVWVLSGQSEESFTPRRLAHGIGCVANRAFCEVDGLLYFLSHDGLYVTDGTAVQPVEGFAKTSHYIRERLNGMHLNTTNANLHAQLWEYDDRVWISLPKTDDSDPNVVLVYDPRYSSWWKTNLPILCAQKMGKDEDGKPRLYFATLPNYGAHKTIVMEYDSSSATVSGEDIDDDASTSGAAVSIPWRVRTSWWPFGLVHAERRVRRTWALVRADKSQTVTITPRKDWVESDIASATVGTTVASSTPIYIEGKWFADSHAVNFKVSGTKAPAAVYGIAVHTEPRRARYHT